MYLKTSYCKLCLLTFETLCSKEPAGCSHRGPPNNSQGSMIRPGLSSAPASYTPHPSPCTKHPQIAKPETLRGAAQRRGRVDDFLGERAIAEFGDDQILGHAFPIRPDSSVALSSRFGVHDYG